MTKRGKSGASVLARPPRQITLLTHIPRQYGTTGLCDRPHLEGEEVSGQLQPQRMHVGGSFSSSGQLREITRENNRGRSGSQYPRKGALTFF